LLCGTLVRIVGRILVARDSYFGRFARHGDGDPAAFVVALLTSFSVVGFTMQSRCSLAGYCARR
jgi:hypothetical protein